MKICKVILKLILFNSFLVILDFYKIYNFCNYLLFIYPNLKIVLISTKFCTIILNNAQLYKLYSFYSHFW